uniref:Retrotrans_gag domain-containing protein n=1 Tax=Steinernema glaseri TaxID=37863 RepID=A0A1I8AL33_9BILA
MLRMQCAIARREELKSLDALTGFEESEKVKTFFRKFEEIVEDCNSRERLKLLRNKCQDRAERLLGYILEEGDNSYGSVKAKLLRQISGGSIESSQARQVLMDGMFR